VYFRHRYTELDKVAISLPASYRLEAMPSETDYKTPFATFKVMRTSQAGVVQLERHAVMNGYYFPIESYSSLKGYFEKLRQSDAENVVLHQVELSQPH
jgi:hypothetical protein